LANGGHLKIERLLNPRLETCDVIVTDMAAVFAQMCRNAVGTCGDGDLGGTQRVGVTAAAGVTDRRHVVDIDAQAKLGGVRLPLGNRFWRLRHSVSFNLVVEHPHVITANGILNA
jgi:hypothetical protein